MGSAVQEKKERNEQLFKDYQAGMSKTELQIKYAISYPRLYQIITQMKKKLSKTSAKLN
jgi:Mor family transcriptional regulator